MAMELIKENIEYEQLLCENTADTVIKAEYIIPDTHPDVYEVLVLDAKPFIKTKEVMQDKIYLEGEIEYNILYLAKEEDKSELYNVTYTGKFANYVDMAGAMHKMACEAECYIEHMGCVMSNERKVVIEGIIKLKSEVYKEYSFEIIRNIEGMKDVQLLKSPTQVDKIIGNVCGDLIAKTHIQIPMDKPQVGTVLKCDVNLRKKDTKILEGKILVEAFASVEILYKAKDSRDIAYINEEVFVSKELELEGVNSSMNQYSDLRVDAVEFDVKEDDLGENRAIDVESLIKASTKVMAKEEMDMIQDAYSPQMMIEMEKKQYALNVMHGHTMTQAIVKGNIELSSSTDVPTQIIMSEGKVCITDKKIVEDKVIVEGIIKVDVMYKNSNEDRYIGTVSEEMPFSCGVEILGSKIDMECVAKVFLENLESNIEANTIGVKAIINVYARVNYMTQKDFLVNLTPVEGEMPKKKASVTIYAVQPTDTLWKIAKKYSTTIDILTKVNEIEDSDYIKAGQKLIVPGRAII